ncbi:MAG: hypothetical protein F6K23_02820 [Okeania sp. SIO2C9]|uniref:hypothetical protein n=1 Tax=Okeania sp. SIO2C9 TaxID=2607791 RepID=UPI0013C11C1E|nr:hypothetical protein [Okeania sp. SIO2C9]NEQ72101.1 hypothetical protein [Okeania sp. SIO2C9]
MKTWVIFHARSDGWEILTGESNYLSGVPEDENISALLLPVGKIPKYLVVSESGILEEAIALNISNPLMSALSKVFSF